MQKERDENIDVLRFIGLSMIILAHINIPGFIFQLRNFDVPLMVLVSGMAFGVSFNNKKGYISYVWGRIKRLVLPVWVFLTLYFSIIYIADRGNIDLNIKTIFLSYSFINGIGYVWIIRVFLLVAPVAPLIYLLNNKVSSDVRYVVYIFLMMCFYEVLRFFSISYINSDIEKLAGYTILYIIPYSLIFSMGLRFISIKEKDIKVISFLSLSVFLTILLCFYLKEGRIVSTQELKYPPSVYYLSYALFISCILLLNIRLIENILDLIKLKNIVNFIASNSIWIYLWHIPLVEFININSFVKYFIVYSVSVFIVYLQYSVVNYIIDNRIENNSLKSKLRVLFTG